MIPGVVASQQRKPALPIAQIQRMSGLEDYKKPQANPVTLPVDPTPGNTLLLIVKAGEIPTWDFNTPAGWTDLYYGYSTVASYPCFKVFGKISDGSERVSPTPTFAITTASYIDTEYQEWQGLESLSNLVVTEDVLEYRPTSTVSNWNPVSKVASVQKQVYFSFIAFHNQSGGLITSWTDVQGYVSENHYSYAHKIVNNGESFDTFVSWSNSRYVSGAIIPLRGAT